MAALRPMVTSTPTLTSVAVAPTPSGSGRLAAGPPALVFPPPAMPPGDAPPDAPPLWDAPPAVAPAAAAASVAPVVSPGAADASVVLAFSPAFAFDDAFLPVLLVDPHAASKPSSTRRAIDRRSDRLARMRTKTPSPRCPKARHTSRVTPRRRAHCRRGPWLQTPRS